MIYIGLVPGSVDTVNKIFAKSKHIVPAILYTHRSVCAAVCVLSLACFVASWSTTHLDMDVYTFFKGACLSRRVLSVPWGGG